MLLVWMLLLSLAASAIICTVADVFLKMSWLWIFPLCAFLVFLLLAALGFGFLLILCKGVDQSVPQEDDDPLYRKVTNLYIQSVLPVLRIHVKAQGVEKVPADGRFLLVCNHCSLFDPIALLCALPKSQLAFVSKQENSTMFVIGPMMHKLLCQLINRENDREALKTILNCIQILKEDKASVAVFPEGGILTEDGKLHHFKPGVFKIAQKAKVPIVVCTLKNTLPVVHNILHLKSSHVQLDVLDVIPVETVLAKKTVEIAEYCHDLMAENLGPDLVSD